MNELMKIRDVSLQYGVSVRTLRYYEDMGLMSSIRLDDYAYRVYDEAALHRLEQILILRKLDISIKDIQSIFSSSDCNSLLDVLQKKVNNIDDEAAQLHILKQIITDFINQIKKCSFSKETDIKMLYERVSELESKLNTIESDNMLESTDVSDNENVSKVSLKDLNYINIPDVRIVLLPLCKMVSSGYGFFGEDKFDRFEKWFSSLKKETWEMPKDFLWYDPEKGNSVWWHVKPDYDIDTQDFDIIDFEGGMYATAVSRDGDDEDGNRVYEGIKKWIEKNDTLELDERPGHYTMCHIITDENVKETLGFYQLEILVPVKKI